MTPKIDLVRQQGSLDASPGMPTLGHIPQGNGRTGQFLLWMAQQ
jgi:hypothetical protein